MIRKTLPSSFQQRASQDLHDPRLMNAYTQKAFGLSADYMDNAVRALMNVSQGRMPDSKQMPIITAAARQKYGWGEDRVRAELRKVISNPDPESRIRNYLTGNGLSRLNPREYEVATSLTEKALKIDLQLGVEERLGSGNGNNAPRDNFNGMAGDKRVIDDSNNSQDIRNRLNILSGNLKPQTYQDKVAAVTEARLKLADRIEHQAAKHEREGTEPSLRESLSQNYDVQVVSDASQDVGFENVREVAEDRFDAEHGHVSDDYDVTENLRD